MTYVALFFAVLAIGLACRAAWLQLEVEHLTCQRNWYRASWEELENERKVVQLRPERKAA